MAIKASYSPACDACGSPNGDRDEMLCRKCRAARTPFPFGARVRVQIADPGKWANGSAAQINGAVGAVTDFQSSSFNGDMEPSGKHGPAWLVTFDTPVPSWHSHGMPHTAFWISRSDLAAEP